MAGQVEALLLAMLAAIPIYLILRMPWRKHDSREWLLGAFWIMMLSLGVMVFRGGVIPAGENIFTLAGLRLREGYMINLIPLKTIRGYFTVRGSERYYINIIGNIVLFVPLGLGLPLLWKRMHNFLRLGLMLVLVPVFIEAVQLFIGRSVDIDDIILNFLGGLIGAAIYGIVILLFPKAKKYAR